MDDYVFIVTESVLISAAFALGMGILWCNVYLKEKHLEEKKGKLEKIFEDSSPTERRKMSEIGKIIQQNPKTFDYIEKKYQSSKK